MNRGSPGGASDAILDFADRLRSSRKAQPEEQKTFENWIVFSVSNRALALPVSHVREILRLEGLTGVPNAPQPVAGVMNLRGHVLPVVDTHALLGLPGSPVTDASRVLIFLLNNRSIGLVVDDVTGLEKLQAELVQTVTESEPLARVSKGILPRRDDQPLLLLDPARLLAGDYLALN